MFANEVSISDVAARRLHCYAVVSKEAVSRFDFHRKIVSVAMKVGFYVMRKRIRVSTNPVSMNIIISSGRYWLWSGTQGRWSNCQKNKKQCCEYCGKCMHKKVFLSFINNLLLVTSNHVLKIENIFTIPCFCMIWIEIFAKIYKRFSHRRRSTSGTYLWFYFYFTLHSKIRRTNLEII